jgi:hypothetical protein
MAAMALITLDVFDDLVDQLTTARDRFPAREARELDEFTHIEYLIVSALNRREAVHKPSSVDFTRPA